jgi:hypothetical protein
MVSTANLVNLVSTTYLTSQFTSTIIGLGTSGYISSSQLQSTAQSLSDKINALSIDVTGDQLVSTVIGLGTTGYISSTQLFSTTQGIYASIPVGLTSTVIGLGTVGYLSTTLSTNIYQELFVNTISAGRITISSATVLNTITAASTNTSILSTGLVNAFIVSAGTIKALEVDAAIIGQTNLTVFNGDGANILNINSQHLTGYIPSARFGPQFRLQHLNNMVI